MSRIKTHVKKGDQVEVITGNHKGKRGTVLQVRRRQGPASSSRASAQDQEGQRKPPSSTPTAASSSIDGPIHISNVKKVG